MHKKGWVVTFAGLTLNLALGVLYAWSMFSKQLTEAVEKGGYGWTRTQATLPYTVAIAFFALMMVPAGRLQDKVGPRLVATAGALLCGIGLVVSSFGGPATVWPVVLGFGVLTGMGLGLGYASTTPPAVKWFGREKKGLITGIVVAGFGVAPVYIAPLSKHLLVSQGIGRSFLILGSLFGVVATAAAQFVRNPPPGYLPATAGAAKKPKPAAKDQPWQAMLKSPVFYSLYIQYACAATAGLMIVGHMAKIVAVQSGNTIKAGFLFVAVLAAFNAGGRVLAGIASDAIGRVSTLISVFVIQAIIMFAFTQFSTAPLLFFGAACVGFNYGACLSLFPSAAADYWGMKNLGLNYGILFTAWGVGGVFGPILAGAIADATGTYTRAYHIAGGLLALAALLATLGHIFLSSKEAPDPST